MSKRTKLLFDIGELELKMGIDGVHEMEDILREFTGILKRSLLFVKVDNELPIDDTESKADDLIKHEYDYILKELAGASIYGKMINRDNHKELIVGAWHMAKISELLKRWSK